MLAHFTCHNINKMKSFSFNVGNITTWRKYPQNSFEQHMKHFSMWACVTVVSRKIIKSQTSCFKREQVDPSSKSAGMRLCFLFSSGALFFFLLLFLPKGSWVLLPSLPTSELHYYQQSAFKSAPAQHQDVFCMLILRDTDPSLLCRSLMPGVPETAGKTVSARRSAHTMEGLRPP